MAARVLLRCMLCVGQVKSRPIFSSPAESWRAAEKVGKNVPVCAKFLELIAHRMAPQDGRKGFAALHALRGASDFQACF